MKVKIMPISFLNKNFKIILLFIILLLIFYRSPYILFNGRFIAEEGSFWFRNAYLNGPLAGFTQIFWGSGYFNLWANISSVFASFVPLKYSPLVTVYFAFLVQLYVFIFIIFSKSEFVITNLDKLLISFIVLLSPCMVAEVWLNTLTSQVYLTILTILIYFQKYVPNNFFCKSSPVVIFISGLSSILPNTLLPFFIYKYFKSKSKYDLYNLFLLLTTSIIQSYIFIYSKLNNLDWEGQAQRFIISYEKFINFIYNVMVKSFFGRDLTHVIYNKFLININLKILSLLIILVFITFLIKFITKIRSDKILMSLLLMFFFISTVSILGSKMEQVAGRFALIPGIILVLSVYRFFQISHGTIKIITISLITISLSTGIYEFKYNNSIPKLLICKNCPHWSEEVNKWKLDNNYNLKIWLYPRKTMSLN
tara:strand:- start:186 stop:1454 length:1269 start_codon:yes stop_codon:yes gene_type:complete